MLDGYSQLLLTSTNMLMEVLTLSFHSLSYHMRLIYYFKVFFAAVKFLFRLCCYLIYRFHDVVHIIA